MKTTDEEIDDASKESGNIVAENNELLDRLLDGTVTQEGVLQGSDTP